MRIAFTLMLAVGGALVLMGVLFTLQGLGFVGGSVMSGDRTWAVIGPILVVIGLIALGAGLRGGRSTPRG